jgi:hypothetical protein
MQYPLLRLLIVQLSPKAVLGIPLLYEDESNYTRLGLHLK